MENNYEVKEKLVTVVIPSYNHGNYIEQCLLSIIKQDYKRIELIIIDDGSTDSTISEINSMKKQLQQRFERFVFVDKKQNEGICTTINRGIRLAMGEYIKPFASDDVMVKSAISKLVSFLEQNPMCDIVYSEGFNIEAENLSNGIFNREEMSPLSSTFKFLSGNNLFSELVKLEGTTPIISSLIRKSCFNEVGLFDEKLLAEDVDFFLRASKKKCTFNYITEPLIFHRNHNNNTGKLFRITYKKLLEKYRDKTDFFEDNFQKKRFIERCCLLTLDKDYYKTLSENYKLIGWGTSGFYKQVTDQIKINFSYLIDSDKRKQGKYIDNFLVNAPENLLSEKKEEIFILILSSYRKEISSWLDNNGFIKYKNYY